LSGVPSSGRSLAEPLRDINEKNRENLVVSNREIRRLFDTMKELGDVIKRQNARLESIEQKVEESRSEMVIAKEELRKMRDHAGQVAQKENAHHGPLPNEVKGDVHLLHNKQDLNEQFRGSEGVDSPHNTEVRKFLYEELKKENSGYSKSSIMRAVTRYYETKRQQYLDSLSARKELVEKKQLEKKLTSRRRRLFAKRMKVASETERESLKQLDSRYMSDEEDGEEGEGGAWVVRSPPWRSQRLSSLLRRLQERVNSKQTPSSHPQNPRVPGMPSMRSPPKSSPPWAVDRSGEHQTPPSFHTPRAEIQQRTPRNHRRAQVKKVPRAGRHLTTPSCLEERVDGALCQRSTEYSSPQSSQSDSFWDSDEIWSVVCQNAPVRERRRKRVLDSGSDSDRE